VREARSAANYAVERSRFLPQAKEGKRRQWKQVGFAAGKEALLECRGA